MYGLKGRRGEGFNRVVSWALGVIFLFGFLPTIQAQEIRSPNIVFILADDLGWGEVGCYGQEKIPTPNLDQLAREGSRFTQHYSGAPVCAPSRCVLLTGKHMGHAQIRGNQQAKRMFPEFTEGQHPITADQYTLAEWFKDQGYATGAMGKWGLGPVGSTGDPNRQGFDLFVGYNCQAVAHSYFARYIWENDRQIEINPEPVPGHRKMPEGDVTIQAFQGKTYAPSVMIDRAIDFIDQHHQEPFFLYLPFIEPHVAIHPPAESVNRFPEEWDDQVYRGESGYLPHPRPRAGYAAMISDLDGYVGRVMEALEKHDLQDQTIVVFTSDNGTTHSGSGASRFHVGGCDADFFNSTAGLRGYKGSVFEGGLRVPMIVRYPGHVPANHVNDTPGYFADWFPTLCEAVGSPAPKNLDGQSLWSSIVSGENRLGGPHRPMIWVYPEYGGQVAVRMGDYKVLRRDLKRPRRTSKWQVYNVVDDPGESQNLAQQKPELIQQAVQILQAQTDPNPVFPLEIPAEEWSAEGPE